MDKPINQLPHKIQEELCLGMNYGPETSNWMYLAFKFGINGVNEICKMREESKMKDLLAHIGTRPVSLLITNLESLKRDDMVSIIKKHVEAEVKKSKPCYFREVAHADTISILGNFFNFDESKFRALCYALKVTDNNVILRIIHKGTNKFETFIEYWKTTSDATLDNFIMAVASLDMEDAIFQACPVLQTRMSDDAIVRLCDVRQKRQEKKFAQQQCYDLVQVQPMTMVVESASMKPIEGSKPVWANVRGDERGYSLVKIEACYVCNADFSTHVISPCGHVSCCDDCATGISKCHKCLGKVLGITKINL